MGQDLTYQAGNDKYEYRISRADWELTQSLREYLPDEVDALFTVAELGDEVSVSTSVLRTAVEKVLVFLAENKKVLPYTYQFKLEIPPDPRMGTGFGTGGMSGIRMTGDEEHYYYIKAGLNICRLEKLGIGPDGRGIVVEKRDIRDEKELSTSNLGRIQIRRTRAKADLVKELPEIQRFLQQVTSAEVIKSVN
jgi:hypothetical protein